jgi:hypothetical protein
MSAHKEYQKSVSTPFTCSRQLSGVLTGEQGTARDTMVDTERLLSQKLDSTDKATEA